MIDTQTVILASISLLGTLTGTFGGILTSNKLVTYRLEQLEKKVESHNSVIDRVYRLEQQNAVQDEKIKELMER